MAATVTINDVLDGHVARLRPEVVYESEPISGTGVS